MEGEGENEREEREGGTRGRKEKRIPLTFSSGDATS
jgi:hypothetical protein